MLSSNINVTIISSEGSNDVIGTTSKTKATVNIFYVILYYIILCYITLHHVT